jgi:hypothetical protein
MWSEAAEVEEMSSSDSDEDEPLATVAAGKAAPLDRATRRQLADKRCPELERVGASQWKQQCPVSAFLVATNPALECKGVETATSFRKLKPARVQQQAAAEFKFRFSRDLSQETLDELGCMENLESLQQELEGERPLTRRHLRLVARVRQFNVFLLDSSVEAQPDEKHSSAQRVTCLSPFEPKWESTALHVRVTQSAPAQNGDQDGAQELVYEVVRQKKDKSSVWEQSSPVVKVRTMGLTLLNLVSCR